MKELAIQLEGFETPAWSASSILDVELMTPKVFDPCTGFFVLADAAHDHGYQDVLNMDVHRWDPERPPHILGDYLTYFTDLSDTTVFMNPPFSKACEFVDHSRMMNARKIICFQRFAWRESNKRREWWRKNPPSRVWVCVDRATCKRFDVRHESMSTPTAHAWFVWERGHKPAEVLEGLYK